ncbi:hypothetical protein GCM10010873_32470 [Cypionkella aquatica]|uniref:Arc-like DNA binding domain-containing protein n=1 Tax=Cypionkella aquatica TaxID=1756042 RepID=A0AA37TV88_9RHOB|nr:Arc family DNA-binding protein [Cypionkella aquatica]GLS88273.1 hypothetical protein GCM10010873_32470 [Cypionkella aquatica]
MTDRKPLQLRLPHDLKNWLKAEAEKNGASQNSEIVRAIRERMDRNRTEALQTQ